MSDLSFSGYLTPERFRPATTISLRDTKAALSPAGPWRPRLRLPPNPSRAPFPANATSREAPHQSGLAYSWRHGRPAIPAQTSGRALQYGLKRVMDISLSVVGLVALAPIFVAVAVAIKSAGPGPVLFRQKRVGLNGELFEMYKFRTMYADRCDQDGTRQASAGDTRITPLGRFMRCRSIDELPQLLNVIKGDMSLVGPRPHVPGMVANGIPYEKLVPYYCLRHSIKPGVTGWAQAHGFRGPTAEVGAAVARVDHDLAYIQNFSLWLDVKTLALTLWREVVKGTGV